VRVDVLQRKMKTYPLFTTSLLILASLNAQTNLRVETERQEWNKDLTDIRLEFDSDASRRYLIEVSDDLTLWEPHYLAPFEFSEEGYWVRQLDSSNPYTPRMEFYKITRLPWTFQTIVKSDDWLGNVSLSSSGDSAQLVYQNRETNELYLTESNPNGVFPAPVVIASTGAVDEPGFWDNSGYSEVTLSHYSGRTFIACTDFIDKKVIILWKDDLSSAWNRHEISDVIENHYWAFPKFSISSSGILGVAYAANSGTVFAFADHSSPESWTSVLVTNSTPNNSASMDMVYSSDTEAHVYIKYGGSFMISTETSAVTSEAFPTPEPSDLTEEESKKINSAYRSESVSYTRLSDDRILIVLSSSGRIIAAVEEN
jgi:hypothetical protein